MAQVTRLKTKGFFNQIPVNVVYKCLNVLQQIGLLHFCLLTNANPLSLLHLLKKKWVSSQYCSSQCCPFVHSSVQQGGLPWT